MGRIAIFGYGSLVSAASAAATLGEVAVTGGARLAGWRRRWSLVRDNARSEKSFAVEPGGELPPWILGLNIEPDPQGEPGQGPNGALILLGPEQLQRLDLRELRYDRIEVTEQVEPAVDGALDVVYAYTAKPERFAPEPPEGAVILRTYLQAVEAAFTGLGEGELEEFQRTTGEPPVPVVEGVLVRDHIPAGNPRAW